ncbi:uncharacterized protein PHALS_08054 [Plasmopara halstedii]|uniref:Uncharacterized protein n=1 Tax=Plasmopara halstedii TaxID=4781 RepID=A0A0P1B7L3_PLAHL|nr:uncharacterized protein PHALS_08054 [Plasmopara halstedii]CEG50337.1 hypothetical protein PHALS_08054 [Plasmopara halstedii]|eukprot:XP_024586706.1 hypothetical protein PHALS_08054 [Plasmopara halstedii]
MDKKMFKRYTNHSSEILPIKIAVPKLYNTAESLDGLINYVRWMIVENSKGSKMPNTDMISGLSGVDAIVL